MALRLATALVGPLAGVEYRRASGRGWVRWVRLAVAVVAALVVLGVCWAAWFTRLTVASSFPFEALRGGLQGLEVLALAGVLILCPAVLAGGLAADKERGALALLLTTRVGPREIVAGRLAGRLGQVGAILLAGLPPLAVLAGVAGISAPNLAAMVALPAAVGFGAGGIAVAASAISRRARDAVFSVFALELLFVIVRALLWTWGASWGVADWLGALSPFSGVAMLAWEDDARPALGTIALWVGMGLAGAAVATWRLRPACLGRLDRPSRRREGRRWRVPPIGERPMLWKELFIERVGALGWLGHGLGILLVAYLACLSIAGAALLAWARWVRPNPGLEAAGLDLMQSTIVLTAPYFNWLIQWAIGLRAAVAIASERERATWDALLMSPMGGPEIVLGKLWGSLFALRWLIAAALGAWTLAAITGAMDVAPYLLTLFELAAVGSFLAAVGVRASLASSSATRAMALTLGNWLVAQIASSVLAGFLFAFVSMAYFALATFYNVATARLGLWTPLTIQTAYAILRLAPFAVAASMVASEARVRFDRIAGRQAGGRVEVAVDRLLHGKPMAPVPASPPASSPAPAGPTALDEDDEILGPAPAKRPRTYRPGPRDWA